MSRIAILAEGAFGWHAGKTATGVIRYSQDPVIAVIDSTQAGQDVAQALHAPFGKDVPIVENIYEALQLQPDTLLIGIAPRGGALPEAWRWQLLAAIEAGLDIVSGLHFFISDDEELRTAAKKRGVKIWDVRQPPEKKRVAEYVSHRAGSHTVLLVGSDCGSGKMTSALELNIAVQRREMNSTFIATGQTGMMIANNGLPVDRLIIDFAAGLVEEIVLDACTKHDWVFVEGQGALNHPGYSPVTQALIHGSMPDAMIFCHKAGQTTIEGYNHVSLPPIRQLIQANENVVNLIRPEQPCKVVGLSIVTHGLTEEDALAAIKQAEEETGLPATDPFRFGVDKLVDALTTHFTR
ncbi:MAG TPA: DUF1611 domain-containing protein [Dictyobacter sp.]|jgi:uncharacterized NAD-dependent epimerase/dehydratase family protein|nr:DUF1611 domain-containing protein [Dictyobacter sp.]